MTSRFVLKQLDYRSRFLCGTVDEGATLTHDRYLELTIQLFRSVCWWLEVVTIKVILFFSVL